MEGPLACPICHLPAADVAQVVPCGHQFCLGCIGRWAEISPMCPDCRTSIDIIKFSMRAEDDYLLLSLHEIEFASREEPEIPEDEPYPDEDLLAPPPSPQDFESSDDDDMQTVGGLLPMVWAELFQREERLLDPVLPWLRRELTRIFGTQWWRINTAVSSIMHTLCLHGPDEQNIVQILHSDLREDTAAVIHGIVNIIVRDCSEQAQRLLVSNIGGPRGNNPARRPRSNNSSSRDEVPPNNLASSGSPDVSQ